MQFVSRRRVGWFIFVTLLVGLSAWLARAIGEEASTSRRQAALFSEWVRSLTFVVEPGPSPAIRFPADGPFDRHLGYVGLPEAVTRLRKQGYAVTAQARLSPELISLHDRGFAAPHREKTQAGLDIHDCRGESLYSARYPARAYPDFDAVPPLLVAALLFIEDNELLDPSPMRNPAVEWDRLAKAVADQLLSKVDPSHAAGGGSTLATQIEKYRHSPGGRTGGAQDKLRQMASASLRAYLDGEDTLSRRREIVVDYLNTVPLSAQAGVGEVHGIGDAMWAWYGRDFDEVNRLLSSLAGGPGDAADRPLAPAPDPAIDPKAALAFKQVLSLVVAQRRPSHYLSPAGTPGLRRLTDNYLRLLAGAAAIAPALRDAALPLPLDVLTRATPAAPAPFVERKAETALRTHLQQLLGVAQGYDLARLDLAVDSSLSAGLQQAASRLLRSLEQPAAAKAAGLYGASLLNEGDDVGRINFSVTLFERAPGANLLRVQTDTVDQPFDLNQGGRLDLGSTAKLRTLITYLEHVEALHGRWSDLDAARLGTLEIGSRDGIGRWARDHLVRSADRSLPAMFEAAMQRTYSANPGEQFFTGRGLHRFENFDSADDGRSLSVGDAFTRSVNLVFVRMMRDVVQRVLADDSGRAELLENAADPRRRQYLARFADEEGSLFVARFHRKYASQPPGEIEALLLQGRRPTPVRLASVFYALAPDADVLQLLDFLGRHLPSAQESAQALHDRHRGGRWSLADRGHLAGVHPLELWVAGYLRQHPQATLGQSLAASVEERQAVYGWLFKTRRKAAQDRRIRGLLEADAFAEIHRTWQRLGYPFDSLTPSYASALGASGDRPAALAELMGIIVNGGLRLATVSVEALHFAKDTPYETRLVREPASGEPVLSAPLAETVRRALIDVVENGTGRRLKGALLRSDGSAIAIGAKTGTGDHRFDTHGRDGRVISSRVVNRSATIVFMIGERYFGTLMAYVHEPHAARYRFTSALPTQLLKTMTGQLLPPIEGSGCADGLPTTARGPARPAPVSREHNQRTQRSIVCCG